MFDSIQLDRLTLDKNGRSVEVRMKELEGASKKKESHDLSLSDEMQVSSREEEEKDESSQEEWNSQQTSANEEHHTAILRQETFSMNS